MREKIENGWTMGELDGRAVDIIVRNFQMGE